MPKKVICVILIWIVMAVFVLILYLFREVSPAKEFIAWMLIMWPILVVLGGGAVVLSSWVLKHDFGHPKGKGGTAHVSLADPPTHVDTRPLRDSSGKIVGGQPFFAEVLFRNKSKVDAVDVYGTVSFSDVNGQEIFPSMRGRWGNSDERGQGAKPRDEEVRTLPADGYPEPILIALKHQQEELAYGLNRDNENKDIGWRDDKKPIPVGTFCVKIILEGRNLPEPQKFSVTLTNRGQTQGIELKS